MLLREIKNFEAAALGIQQATACSLQDAREATSRLLGVAVPDDMQIRRALSIPASRARRGRPRADGLTKRDAVAAVAVYFESGGIGPEQAIQLAKHWLGISLSRRVAKAGVAAFKANTSPEQYQPQAHWAYLTYRFGTTLRLPKPTELQRVRRKRRRLNLN